MGTLTNQAFELVISCIFVIVQLLLLKGCKVQTIAARLRTLDPFLKISDVPPLECHPMSSLEETKLLEKTQ